MLTKQGHTPTIPSMIFFCLCMNQNHCSKHKSHAMCYTTWLNKHTVKAREELKKQMAGVQLDV